MAADHDVIVVGGRCAGATAALALARADLRVLVVDRDELGSDTLSTHTVFPNTIVRLEELGVLDRLRGAHELRFARHRVRMLGRELVGAFTPQRGHDRALAVTRPALDRAFAEAAMAAGAEARFETRVTALIGAGTEGDPVRGVLLEDGEELHADCVIGADGRASFVARTLGLERDRPIAADTSFLFTYWRGLPDTECVHLDVDEAGGLNRIPCEDGIDLLVSFGPPEYSHGDQATRLERHLEALATRPETLDAEWLPDAERLTGVRVAPEPMMRGFFRRASGPGWALIGDAGHFKHPATAQGISDAVEQALWVAGALSGGDRDLEGYDAWRADRAEGHYEWSFSFGRLPVAETAGPIFDGLVRDERAAQDFRDVLSRRVNPGDVFSRERLDRWFAEAGRPVRARS